MSIRTTPLGFVSGDIEVHSHCMFIYSKKDASFVRSIVDFLVAGVGAGEMCACVLDESVIGLVKDRLEQRGIAIEPGKGRIRLYAPEGLILNEGTFDSRGIVEQWSKEFVPLLNSCTGVRTFCDTVPFYRNRVLRLKLLEFESLINLSNPSTITLCGYDSGAAGRSLLAQARNVHPFVANSRSIRRNPAFMSTARFLSGFYRFRRVSKEYVASIGEADVVCRDLEETASRTPMTMPDIRDFCTAIGGLFAHMVEKGDRTLSCKTEKPHLHVTFVMETDKMIVTIRGHACTGVAPSPGLHEHVQSSMPLTSGLVDELMVESWKGDLVATIVKKYRPASIIEDYSPLEGIDAV